MKQFQISINGSNPKNDNVFSDDIKSAFVIARKRFPRAKNLTLMEV